MRTQTLLTVICYALLYVVWGSTYFFIKVSVETIPPLVVVAARWLFGGALFLAYYFARHGVRRPTFRETALASGMGMLIIFVPNTLLTMAERGVESHTAALVSAAIPIAVAFFDRFLLGRRIAPVALAGMALGVVGVGIILYDGRSPLSSLTVGVLMLFVGLAVWSLGTSIGHRVNQRINTILYTGLQMLASGAVSLALIVFAHRGDLRGLDLASGRSLWALAYLVTVGSVAFAAYNYLIKHEPAVRVTSYALVNPVIAVLLGLFLGREAPAPYLAAGLPVVLAGLGLMLYGQPLLDAFRRKPDCGTNAEIEGETA